MRRRMARDPADMASGPNWCCTEKSASMPAMNRRDFMLGNATGLAVGAVGGYAGRAFGSTNLQRDLTNPRADGTSPERELAKAEDELAKLGSAREHLAELQFDATHGRHSYAQW